MRVAAILVERIAGAQTDTGCEVVFVQLPHVVVACRGYVGKDTVPSDTVEARLADVRAVASTGVEPAAAAVAQPTSVVRSAPHCHDELR